MLIKRTLSVAKFLYKELVSLDYTATPRPVPFKCTGSPFACRALLGACLLSVQKSYTSLGSATFVVKALAASANISSV